jgi:hypothetical protein
MGERKEESLPWSKVDLLATSWEGLLPPMSSSKSASQTYSETSQRFETNPPLSDLFLPSFPSLRSPPSRKAMRINNTLIYPSLYSSTSSHSTLNTLYLTSPSGAALLPLLDPPPAPPKPSGPVISSVEVETRR